MVRTDARGLPTIIPWKLREVFVKVNTQFILNEQISVPTMRVIVCILTVISIFRVFNVFPKASLNTVITPFSGSVMTLPDNELQQAIQQIFPGFALKLKAPRVLVLETASPNATKSTWGAVLDAAAFLFYPKTGYYLLKYNLFQNFSGTRWNLWILCILVAAVPVMIFIFILGGVQELFVGKLGVVKDQAGKSRIVGITNYWIQIALKPLHDALFALLKKVNMDGTFDQEAPLRRLVAMVPKGQVFHSFDLSAATDRLPVTLQACILNILSPSLGTDWSNLLGSIFWAYKKAEYKYAVGQPMGAYSSWAMLAITHHVIVQVAALRVREIRFSAYAVLGDDIVIANDEVAAEYLRIMEQLGVSINLSKSIESDRFLEFAKRWIGPGGVQFTPIGPGLILRLIRNKFYLAALFSEMFKLGLITTFQELLARIQFLPAKWAGQKWNVLWAAFGLRSFFITDGQVDRNLITWCFQAVGMDEAFMRYNIMNALLQDRLNAKRNAIKQLDTNIAYFLDNFWKLQVGRSWPNRMLEFCLKVFSPGPWAYFLEFIQTKLDLEQAVPSANSGSWSNIQDLAKGSPAINIVDIDWRKKDQIREAIERAKVIVNTYEESQKDVFYMGDNPGEFY
nr:MAG: RNA-dependent RNA polymerase [Rhizoctonia solani mitovirus 67]